MFKINFKELTDLERKIFYEVISSEHGIGEREIVDMAQRLKTTEEKVEQILLKLEIDGFFGSHSDEYN
ncbi:MAG: hypothetical protein ACTSVY_12475 [Candidatus Helarchaeota archaeon]